MAITLDLFGTLVRRPREPSPATAIGQALLARGVLLPDDWPAPFHENHLARVEHEAVPLPVHVQAALGSRDVDVDLGTIRAATVAALDVEPEVRGGAIELLESAASCGPVGLVSNCSVPGLVERVLRRSDLPVEAFDAIVTSVGCGRRKPHPRPFTVAADRLDAAVDGLLHVGDDPVADGGVEALGGTAIVTDDLGLARRRLREAGCRG